MSESDKESSVLLQHILHSEEERRRLNSKPDLFSMGEVQAFEDGTVFDSDEEIEEQTVGTEFRSPISRVRGVNRPTSGLDSRDSKNTRQDEGSASAKPPIKHADINPKPEISANSGLEPRGQDTFLAPQHTPELIYSDPDERFDDSIDLDHAELARILADAGIELRIKYPNRIWPYITDSDPRIVGEE